MAMQNVSLTKAPFQRYAILGCNSFAGANLTHRLLTRGANVIGFNRSDKKPPMFQPFNAKANSACYSFYKSDINSDLEDILTNMDIFRPEVVIDFAGQGMVAESWINPDQWYQTNILAKVRLHDALRSRNYLKKFIRISTPEVYGSHDNLIDEAAVYNPTTPYAVSHAATDMSLRMFHKQYGFPVVFTRFANFYGPGQQLYRIIPRTIIYGLLNKKLVLHGGGSSIRAFINSEDVSTGIELAISGGIVGECYHFSPNDFLNIRQVVELICERLDISFDSLVEIGEDRMGKDHAYLMSSEKARTQLGWQDDIKFEDGIDSTISWIRDNIDTISNMSLVYEHRV